ncbi:MAG: ABC transporter ATP-binding protein [Planctomycetota bacterium]
MIRMNRIKKVYGTDKVRVEALKGFNLLVKKGEFISLMGPSGSGKSTLLNIIGCLDTPSDGEYFLEEERVDRLHHTKLAEIRNKKIGFVFQNFNLLPYATALENVELPMIFSGIKYKERQKRARQLLEEVGLGGRVDHKPTELSGGEMQRVAIARALVNSPSIILADEPTGNLDSKSGEEIVSILERLWHKGHTILIVTHNQEISMRTGRILRLKDGLLEQSD